MFTDDEVLEVYLLDAVRWLQMSKPYLLFQEGRLYLRVIDPGSAAERQRAFRVDHHRLGKCVSCGNDVDPSSTRRCAYHLKQEREYANARSLKKRSIAAAFVLCALLFAATVEASPITASHSGCHSSLPDGASWLADSPGFVFLAFYDMEAGCAPTIRNPTGGFHLITPGDHSYRVDVLAKLLPTCGRVQFDAQSYNSTGLDPFGLTALVFDSGIDCVFSEFPEFTELSGRVFDGVDRPVRLANSSDTPQTPPNDHSVPPDVPITVPVPDGSSTLALLAVALLALVRMR